LGMVFQGNSLSEGIAMWPKGSLHTLADDRNTRSGGVVLTTKGPTAQQWHSHHPEVFRTHGRLIQHVGRRHWLPAIDMKVPPHQGAIEGKPIDCAGRQYARQVG